MGACPLPRHDVEWRNNRDEGIHRVISAPRRMPKKMQLTWANGCFSSLAAWPSG
jgi:hypothetical protein